MSWEECIQQARNVSDHYSIEEEAQKYIYELVEKLPNSSVVVELGVCHGKTAAIIGYVAKRNGFKYYGVDNFSLEDTYEGVTGVLKILDIDVNIIKGNTNDVPWQSSIDLLIIDAAHDEPNVRQDCEKWIPFVKTGGIVVFDDWGDWTGAHSAITKYEQQYTGTWEDLGVYGEKTKFKKKI